MNMEEVKVEKPAQEMDGENIENSDYGQLIDELIESPKPVRLPNAPRYDEIAGKDDLEIKKAA